LNKFPDTKKCFECGAEAKHQGRPYEYKLPNNLKTITLVMDEGVYKCQNDDCGIIWDENGDP
jgi:hypothetical protein